jgi:di/tricarboxylate transporter
MTTRTDALAHQPVRDAQAIRAVPATRPDAPAVRTLLWQAALLGLSADALLHDTIVGPALALWVIVLALAALALTWSASRKIPQEALVWFMVAVALASLTAWRDSGALQFLDVLATVTALGFAAVALRDPAPGAYTQLTLPTTSRV